MKVILIADVKSLGKEGELVEVSDGHARNFLFPQNLAIQATAEGLKRIADREKMEKKVAHKKLSTAGDMAARLEGREFVIEERVNKEGGLYASVSAAAVVKALKAEDFKIKKEMVKISDPIKEVGEHKVKIDLDQGFEANIKLIIEGK